MLKRKETYLLVCPPFIPMIDAPEFERWFNQALHTHDSAQRDYGHSDFDWACFKFQQAAEFALEAFLRSAGKLGAGHSLLKLTEEIETLGITTEEIKKCSLTLEKFYILTRYPDAYPEGSPYEFYDAEEAERALNCSSRIIEFVRKRYYEQCDRAEKEREEKSPGKS